MNIVIAGAGAVGTHLAKLLSKEHLNVVLIDSDETKLSKVGTEFDIMTYHSSPNSIKALKHTNVDKADLFIAVTPFESLNITCCMLAHQLGAKKTVARIDNFEYMKTANYGVFVNDAVGISSLIYPEMLAGKEIADSCQYTWVRQWWEFNNGELVLLSVKMHREAPIVGKKLKEVAASAGRKFHVVAIKRGSKTISPNGEEVIKNEDLVFFMVLRNDIEHIKVLTGKDNPTYPDVRDVMIIGGSKLAVRASWSFPKNVNIKIIEPDEERCQHISEVVREGTLVMCGDSHDLQLLEDEGLDHIDALIALTENDDENILACVSARRRGIRRTIAQVENMDYLEMAEDLDVGTIINKKTIAASHIYRMLMKADVNSVKMLNVAEAEVAEFMVKANSKVTGKPIKDLSLPKGVNLGGMMRNGQSMLVNGLTQLQEGDRVVAFCVENTLKKLEKYFR